MTVPERLADLWPEIAAALPPELQRIPEAMRPAGPPGQPSKRVWKVSLIGGGALAVKLAVEDAPLIGEVQALAWLRKRGCSVPAVVAVSSATPPQWAALEWCGDVTLDEEAQRATPTRLFTLGRELAKVVASVEDAFTPLTARRRAEPTAAAARAAALRSQYAAWIAAAPGALSWLVERPISKALETALDAAVQEALGANPDIGSLDYNACNVAFDRHHLSLLDFSAVGVDWPERRFVQYGTATGAGLADGNFASVIGVASTRAYADAVARARDSTVREVQRRVDAHDALILLTAAESLRHVEKGSAHPERAAAWSNVSQRRAQLLALLRRRVAPDGPAEELRSYLRRT